MRSLLGVAALVLLSACSTMQVDEQAESSDSHFELVNASKWFRWLESTHPEWAIESDPSSADPSPWPGGYAPGSSQIFAHNDILLEGVSPTEVFDLMSRPNEYRAFYPNSGRASTNELGSVGQTYSWSTFGVSQTNTVTELVRNSRESRIAWLAVSTGTKAMHRWIFRAEGGGTRVITEECQTGWVAALPSFISSMATSLPAAHELWVNGLRCTLVEAAKDDEMCTTTIHANLENAPAP